jgi:glycosyltransferase 2 family protein
VSVPSSPDLYSMVPPEALGTILVGAFGFGRVVHAVLSVGWAGFGVICGSQLLIFLPLGFVWSEIAADARVGRPTLLIWARMVRDASINLPLFSQFGGFFFGARAVMLRGLT